MSTRKKAASEKEAEQMVAEQKAEMQPVQALTVDGPTGTNTGPITALTTPPAQTQAIVAYESEFDLSDDELGQGHEERRKEDNKVPLLYVLQSGSPQVKACKDGSIRAGMLYDTVSGKTWDPTEKPVVMHLCFYKTEGVVWKKRTKGGGLVAVLDIDDEEVVMAIAKAKADNGGKLKSRVPWRDDDHELMETITAFGVIDDGMDIHAFAFPHVSAKLGSIRSVTQQMQGFRLDPQRHNQAPPMAHFAIGCSTFEKPFTEGSAYVTKYAPAIKEGPGPVPVDKPTGKLDADGKAIIQRVIEVQPGQKGLRASFKGKNDPAYRAAKALYDAVTSGKLVVDHAQAQKAEGDGPADDEPPPF